MNKNIMKTRTMKAMSKKVMARAWELKHEDNNYNWGECLKMAWVEVKAAKKSPKASKAVKTTKAVKDMAIVIDADAEVQAVVNGNVNVENLMNYTREILIQVMKKLHVKRWYRIYDKATMIENIIKCVVA